VIVGGKAGQSPHRTHWRQVSVVKTPVTKAMHAATAATISSLVAAVRDGHGYHEVAVSRLATKRSPPAPPAMKAVAIIPARRACTGQVLRLGEANEGRHAGT